jgi:hypothetical protein
VIHVGVVPRTPAWRRQSHERGGGGPALGARPRCAIVPRSRSVASRRARPSPPWTLTARHPRVWQLDRHASPGVPHGPRCPELCQQSPGDARSAVDEPQLSVRRIPMSYVVLSEPAWTRQTGAALHILGTAVRVTVLLRPSHQRGIRPRALPRVL